jgi:hypothetical protein
MAGRQEEHTAVQCMPELLRTLPYCATSDCSGVLFSRHAVSTLGSHDRVIQAVCAFRSKVCDGLEERVGGRAWTRSWNSIRRRTPELPYRKSRRYPCQCAMPASPDPKEASRALRSLSSRPNQPLAQRPEHAHARRIGEQIGAFRRHHSETASAHAAIQADGFHPLHISVAR